MLGLPSVGLPTFQQELNFLMLFLLSSHPWKTLPATRKGFGLVVCTIAHAQITVGSEVFKRLGVVLEKTLESPLDSREIKPKGDPKGDQL